MKTLIQKKIDAMCPPVNMGEVKIITSTIRYSISNKDGGRHMVVYLYDFIETPDKYIDIIHFLNTATEKDTIMLFINNNGGVMVTGFILRHALQKSKAHSVSVVSGLAASAAAVTASACNTLIIKKLSYLMFHTASGMWYGKTGSSASQIEYINNIVRAQVQDCVEKGLLTEQELTDILEKDKDVFIDDNEVSSRLSQDQYSNSYKQIPQELTARFEGVY